MSTIQTNSITDAAGTGAPDFPNGIEVSGGDVGIGTVPAAKFHVNSGLANLAGLFESADAGATITLIDNSTTGGSVAEQGLNTVGDELEVRAVSTLAFETAATERMRIDSSGNLLVGMTSSSSAADGCRLLGIGSLTASRDGSNAAVFNRKTSDGSIVEFRKNDAAVGSIGTTTSAFWIASPTENRGVKLVSDDLRPTLGTGVDSDNSMDLGDLTVRWDDVYATNGTIQTSDRNEKQDIEELSEAERRVAVACKGLMRKFRWISSVAEKGDDARIHFGIIAQDLQAAFAAEGLDAGRYAMFISSTWWEHDGKIYDTAEEAPEGATERTRLGVRYPELLAFMIAVL